MAVGDGCQGGLEIGEGLDAVDLAGFDQRGDATPGDAALVVAGEECVLAIEGDGADQVFDPVGVDLDAAVLQEPKIPTICMNNHIYQKASTLVLSFGVLALATNGVQLFFFSFDELAADGVSYTKDYSGLLQGAIYLGICVALAYFIRKQNKVAAVFAGSMAAVIGLSTFWLALLSDAQNLITAVDTLEPGASFFDFFVLMCGFHVVISVISICLCIMITGTTFSAVFGKKKQP